ncbi:MAG: adenylate/guanylate cyclase domain-containing protein [Pseudomonadota bacterium]
MRGGMDEPAVAVHCDQSALVRGPPFDSARRGDACIDMRSDNIDPAPRKYANFVTINRRMSRGPSCAPEVTTAAEIEDWLLRDAPQIDDFLLLVEEFFWRIVASGAPLNRASLHVGTLHPQIAGYGMNWMSSDQILDEVVVDLQSRKQDSFILNPLYLVFEKGETVRGDPRDAAARERFPLFSDLYEQGVTDYLARPIGRGGAYHKAATIGTFRPERFSDEEIAGITRLFDIFALHAERHIAAKVARNVVDAYLGGTAGGEVLSGGILRGDGRPIRAVVWVSDMRGFSERADRLSPDEVTAMLNLYFEALSGAVMDHGGEVLKFVGDGLLAVFPVEPLGAADAARRSLAAARDGLARTAALNAAPPPGLAAAALPLKSGVGLHLGEVFFGNVGAPDRLDFTVIGRAVNEASRVEALTKTLGREILLTDPVHALLDGAHEDMGAHPLRGVAAPMSLFAASPEMAAETA